MRAAIRYFRCAALVLFLSIAGASYAAAQQVVEYYHLDAIGSVRMVTNQSGSVLERRDYLPFGEEVVVLGGQPRRFVGKERDGETGFDYFGARYYASRTGRFTTVDPVLDMQQALVEPQRWNRYAYALNNPLKFADPDGKNPLLVAGGIIWGIYEIGSSIYDAYTTYQIVRDPNASTTEKLTTGGLFVAGMLPGVPGGSATAARQADDVADLTGVARNAAKHPAWLPSFQKVSVDWDHILSGHTEAGARVLGGKDATLFPHTWSEKKIKSAIQEAYTNSTIVRTQRDRVLLKGTSGSQTIYLWYNRVSKGIETAYPNP